MGFGFISAVDLPTTAYYSKHAPRLAREYAKVEPGYFDEIDAAFQGCLSVLDVGCGTGRDTLHLTNTGKRAVGVEPSAHMLAEARSAFERAGLDWNDKLIEASLPKLSPVRDGSFDGVLCAGC